MKKILIISIAAFAANYAANAGCSLPKDLGVPSSPFVLSGSAKHDSATTPVTKQTRVSGRAQAGNQSNRSDQRVTAR
ncbi:MAG: hypothetical protein DME50_12325 [Verrucomicrobia bacterium]|nr:MAG: hypothetical protein DME50_12325 [Verrucomicrobiota bacterium]